MTMTIIISCYKKDKDNDDWQSIDNEKLKIGNYGKSYLNSKKNLCNNYLYFLHQLLPLSFSTFSSLSSLSQPSSHSSVSPRPCLFLLRKKFASFALILTSPEIQPSF